MTSSSFSISSFFCLTILFCSKSSSIFFSKSLVSYAISLVFYSLILICSFFRLISFSKSLSRPKIMAFYSAIFSQYFTVNCLKSWYSIDMVSICSLYLFSMLLNSFLTSCKQLLLASSLEFNSYSFVNISLLRRSFSAINYSYSTKSFSFQSLRLIF